MGVFVIVENFALFVKPHNEDLGERMMDNELSYSSII